MFKSMTGYGRHEISDGGKKIMVEIKSVNHRYSDYSVKVPRYYGYLEDKIREYVSKKVQRGKIDIYVSIESYGEADKQIILNEELAENYIEVLRQMAEKFNLRDDITVSSVARYQEIFKSERKEENDEEIWELVKNVLEPAVSAFFRKTEFTVTTDDVHITVFVTIVFTVHKKEVSHAKGLESGTRTL